ncbi:MAG TPA: polyphosphate kinase 1 [Treponemataceae bacterium]|nr:polyphosphate kinase 1 [Treponemataceae bacterium]
MKNDNSFFNRDLSWIEFNARVLSEALSSRVPLLERLRFLTIVSSNFDEFFMVRVASLKAQCKTNCDEKDLSGLTVLEQLTQISLRVRELVSMQYDCLLNQLLPGLALEGLLYVDPSSYTVEQERYLDSFFVSDVFPLLTPVRTGSDAVFPSIGNLRLHAAFKLQGNLAVPTSAMTSFLEKVGVFHCQQDKKTETSGPENIAIVQIPTSIPRIVWLPGEQGARCFTLIDDVVRTFGQSLFPGFTIKESLFFKLTRAADLTVDEDRDTDFIAAIEEILVSRLYSVPVRLMCTGDSPFILEYLKTGMRLQDSDIYPVSGPLDLPTLIELSNAEGFDHIRNPVWKNYWPVELPVDAPFWNELKRRDVLLHVPYQSWDPILRFINDSADDSSVLAIKMTLYRTSGDSPVIQALARAARSGKHVTVFVEIKARFDEARNISWAQRLEEVGVIVVYGIARLKVHAKILLVIRREREGIKRYVHLSTGNYNDKTAKFYEDLSIFTTNEEIANDATLFFNMISGCSSVLEMKRLIMAPINLKSELLALIDREISKTTPENPGHIIAKLNSLGDSGLINALYRASNAGVKIELNVRGLCVLVPGVPGMSENIRVVSVVDRFLEHARMVWFQNGGADDLYLSSADWLPRNLERRIELLFPVLDKNIKKTVLDILHMYFIDNTNAHYLLSDGTWLRRQPGKDEKEIRVQTLLHIAEKRKAELFAQEPQREFIVRRIES